MLKLPRAATYAAEIFYSLNDEPFIHAGTLTASDDGVSTLATPWAPREPGFHHPRFQARITYGGAAADLPQEIRRLADVSYGIYDPDRGLRPDLAQFVMAPSRMSAQQLDPSLPDVPFVEWLRQLPRDAGAHAEQSLWTSVHCPRGPRIVDGPSNFGDICAVGYLPFGLAWIRTGRIQRYGDRARLVAQHPKVLAIQVLGREATEVYSLSDLSELFAMDPEQWPATNVSVVPQDIAVTRTGSGNLAMMDVTVTLRNYGGVDARDVLVTMMLSDGHEIYMFHLDVPRRGSTTFKWSEPMPWPYGAVVVTVDTIAGIGTAALRRDESTPERVKAFRFPNPSLAPPAYWDWLRSNGY